MRCALTGARREQIQWLYEEHGAEAVAVMKKVKQALDPLGIFNPGKLFREDGAKL